jgi:hypothetical protein
MEQQEITKTVPPAPVERVRERTAENVNRRIDRLTAASLRAASDEGQEEKIRGLDLEWDVERVLETNAATISLAGVVLGTLVNRKWLVLPAIVFPFLVQHAIQGWCPPIPVFRRLGVRTQDEIDREKYARKALRGDFRSVPGEGDPEHRAAQALEAVLT